MSDEAIEQLRRVMEAGSGTLADLARETNARLDETNARLDETNSRLGRLEGRFDDLLDITGRETRSLRDELRDLESRVDALEKKAS